MMLTIMDKEAVRKAFIRNVPYVLSALYATNIGRAWRLAAGSSPSGKIFPFLQLLPSALSRFVPSAAPADLLFGAVFGAMLKAAVYLKGKNAKHFRKGEEYGSAKWSA